MSNVRVTDHAILRYFERAHGLDIEFFRRHLAALASSGVREGASAVIAEGVKLILVEDTVVTVYERDWPSVDRRSEDGKR